MLAICRREVLKQFNFVTGRHFQNGELQFSAFYPRDLFHSLAGLMRGMRKFKTEHIAPERERPFEIRDRNSGMICPNDLEIH